MVFRYISSKLKQINSHILFFPLWLMHLLLSGQEFAKRKKQTNKQRDKWKQRSHLLLLSDSIVRLFFHLETACAFCVRGVQNWGSGAKQTEKKNKTKQKNGETSYIVFYDRSFKLRCWPFFDQTTHQRLFFLQVTVADNTNSRNNNAIGEITHDKMFISLSECILWFTVFTAGCIALVTVNLLSIILFIKNKSLRTRSMYLVMSLTVADLLVGSLSGSVYLLYNN